MKIWPIFLNTKLKKAFNLRKEEFHYRLGEDPLTTAIKVRHLKNGSTVFARYSNRFGTEYATDVYLFRSNASIETKSYHYIRESNAKDSKSIGEIITKTFFKKNSYEPYKTTTKTVWK